MARWIDEGAAMHAAVFSTAETSLPPGSKAYRLKDECHLALDQLEVPRENRFIYDYPVRELGYHRQEVLEEMVQPRARPRSPTWSSCPRGRTCTRTTASSTRRACARSATSP